MGTVTKQAYCLGLKIKKGLIQTAIFLFIQILEMRKLITLEKMKQKQGEDRWNLDKKGGKSQLDINFSAFNIRDYELI